MPKYDDFNFNLDVQTTTISNKDYSMSCSPGCISYCSEGRTCRCED